MLHNQVALAGGPNTPVSQDGSESSKISQDSINMPPPPTPPTSTAYPRITGEDPYAKAPGTPHPSAGFPPFPRVQGPRTPSTTSPSDPFVKPALPAMTRADPFAPGAPQRPQGEFQNPRPQDPYSVQPATPRPQEMFMQQRGLDPYAMQPGTPRPQSEFQRDLRPPMEFEGYRGPRPGGPGPAGLASQDPFARAPQYRPRLPAPFQAARPTNLGEPLTPTSQESRFMRPQGPHVDPFSPDADMADLQDIMAQNANQLVSVYNLVVALFASIYLLFYFNLPSFALTAYFAQICMIL